MSFPLEALSRPELPPLSFRIAGRSSEQVRINSELISSETDAYTFNQSALLAALKVRQLCNACRIHFCHFQTPIKMVYKIGQWESFAAFQSKQASDSSAKHFNIEVARYTLPVTCLPLNLVAHWKCEPEQTDIRLDYEYIGSALSKALPLTNVKVLAPVNGGVDGVQSMPEGIWSSDHQKILWKLDELKSGADAKGCLRARFVLKEGPSTPASVDVQFLCDGTILSGTEFELNTKRYRVSFTQRRMHGKFLVDTDKLVTYV